MQHNFSQLRPLSPLAKYVAGTCVVLITYASLYPFTGWHWSGLPIFDFLTASWPRWFTWGDLILNVLGYIPLGFSLCAALPHRWSRLRAAKWSIVLCFFLSFGLETLQNFLPTRVASNVDIGTNTLGAFLGAGLALCFGDRFFATHAGLHRWRMHRLVAGRPGEFGLILIGMWLLAQCSPGLRIFEFGRLVGFWELWQQNVYSPLRFVTTEAIAVCLHMLATGGFMLCLLNRASLRLIYLVLLLGIGLRSAAIGMHYDSASVWMWLTPGACLGLVMGGVLLCYLARRSRAGLFRVCMVCLFLSVLSANLVPINPYYAEISPSFRGLNFFGFTYWVSVFWPLLVFCFMCLPAVHRQMVKRSFLNYF